MSEMVERVWKSISDSLRKYGDADIKAGLGWLTDEQEKAISRAAIAAMREPPPAMLEAGRRGFSRTVSWDRDAALTWRDMIDEALR